MCLVVCLSVLIHILTYLAECIYDSNTKRENYHNLSNWIHHRGRYNSHVSRPINLVNVFGCVVITVNTYTDAPSRAPQLRFKHQPRELSRSPELNSSSRPIQPACSPPQKTSECVWYEVDVRYDIFEWACCLTTSISPPPDNIIAMSLIVGHVNTFDWINCRQIW